MEQSFLPQSLVPFDLLSGGGDLTAEPTSEQFFDGFRMKSPIVALNESLWLNGCTVDIICIRLCLYSLVSLTDVSFSHFVLICLSNRTSHSARP